MFRKGIKHDEYIENFSLESHWNINSKKSKEREQREEEVKGKEKELALRKHAGDARKGAVSEIKYAKIANIKENA